MPTWSPDAILIAALAVFVAIIALFVFHILLGVQQLVRLGEMRRDWAREEEQAHLTSLQGKRWGLRAEVEGESREHHLQQESGQPKSLPVAGSYLQQVQSLEIHHRADKLEEEISCLKQAYTNLEEDLRQVREHQREADQERQRILEDLQNIRQILNGRFSPKLSSAAFSKVHRLLSLPNARGDR